MNDHWAGEGGCLMGLLIVCRCEVQIGAHVGRKYIGCIIVNWPFFNCILTNLLG